jgi:hypothetical protein
MGGSVQITRHKWCMSRTFTVCFSRNISLCDVPRECLFQSSRDPVTRRVAEKITRFVDRRARETDVAGPEIIVLRRSKFHPRVVIGKTITHDAEKLIECYGLAARNVTSNPLRRA